MISSGSINSNNIADKQRSEIINQENFHKNLISKDESSNNE